MSDYNDKYPESSDRRRFVKGVVGASALTGLSATAAATVDISTTPAGRGGGPTTFQGVELVRGPAPRGMPQIPVELDDEGYLRGIFPEFDEDSDATTPEMELGGETYSSSWFQYCGTQTSPAVDPNEDLDPYFRYTAASHYDWQNAEVEGGDRIHISDFEDYEDWGNQFGSAGVGKPAQANWRSNQPGDPDDQLEPRDRIPVQIIRSERIEAAAEEDDWLAASTDEGFMAIQNQCTHFCCVPGYKAFPDARDFGAEDKIYCQCHQSVYDPFSIVEQTFVALPRPDN